MPKYSYINILEEIKQAFYNKLSAITGDKKSQMQLADNI